MTGNQIRKKRMELGYTTDKLARKVGVTIKSLRNWEKGVSKPRKQNLIRLYAVLGLGNPFKRERTDAQRLEEKKQRIELTTKLDAKVDKPRKLGSWEDLDDNDPHLLELRKLLGVKV